MTSAHRSRLAGFIIDCQNAELATATRFWSEALGFPQRPPDPSDDKYRVLDTGQKGLHIEIQTVGHPSRVHLDIEASDVEAEVVRLEALGARRIEQVKTWWIMEAPTGQRFCVIRPQGPGRSMVEGDSAQGRAWNDWGERQGHRERDTAPGEDGPLVDPP